MGMWKTLRVSHIPTPPTATADKLRLRRYTNFLLGTKKRSGHYFARRRSDDQYKRSSLLYPIEN